MVGRYPTPENLTPSSFHREFLCTSGLISTRYIHGTPGAYSTIKIASEIRLLTI
jgi:hypothetical protein